jgi:nucleoside-diphosphate-sugar epimerase
MRILVTGSAGFVGQASLAALTEHQVIEYDLMGGYDIRDEKQLGMVVSENQPDRILHLAAIARFADADKDPLQAHATNVLGTKNVAKVASRYHVPLVYASTGSVYMPISEEPPITEDFKVAGNSVYGVTKLMGELYVRQSRSPWMILRYAHLYGVEKRGHGLIGGFIERIERGLAPTLYGGRQSNDFTYIADVARANRLALEASYDRWGEVYNIGTGEELTAEDAGRMVCDAWGYSGDTLVIPARSVDPERFVYDTAKATRMLGFTAEYSFKMGMAEMARTDGAYAPIQVA